MSIVAQKKLVKSSGLTGNGTLKLPTHLKATESMNVNLKNLLLIRKKSTNIKNLPTKFVADSDNADYIKALEMIKKHNEALVQIDSNSKLITVKDCYFVACQMVSEDAKEFIFLSNNVILDASGIEFVVTCNKERTANSYAEFEFKEKGE